MELSRRQLGMRALRGFLGGILTLSLMLWEGQAAVFKKSELKTFREINKNLKEEKKASAKFEDKVHLLYFWPVGVLNVGINCAIIFRG